MKPSQQSWNDIFVISRHGSIPGDVRKGPANGDCQSSPHSRPIGRTFALQKTNRIARADVVGQANRLLEIGFMKTLRFDEAGLDCNFEVHGNTVEEVLKKAADHARKGHDLEVTEDYMDAWRALIHED